MVLSCASPCAQGVSDPGAAAAMAINVNNQLASAISNNTYRFGAFAALAMHNASVAAQELNRTVRELGFLGALINDYQESGVNGSTCEIVRNLYLCLTYGRLDAATLLFYDQPEYDTFWQMATDLNVPVYLHPRNNIPLVQSLLYQHSHWLIGPSQEFAVTLSTHILGLCANGVFEYAPSFLYQKEILHD